MFLPVSTIQRPANDYVVVDNVHGWLEGGPSGGAVEKGVAHPCNVIKS